MYSCRLFVSVLFLIIGFGFVHTLAIKCFRGNSDTIDWCVVVDLNYNDRNEPITIITAPTQDINNIKGLRLRGVCDELPKVFFRSFRNLQNVGVKTGIKSISRADFMNATHLTSLTLRENNLRVIPREVFADVPELIYVDLSKNEISEIEDYAFAGAVNLKKLTLTQNNLTIIRRLTLAGTSTLERIELQNNQIEAVEEGAFDIESLKYLFFGYNRMKQLADNIFSNTPNLEISYFEGNGMTTINKAFYNLKNLSSVSFRDSSLTEVDIYGFVRSNPNLVNFYLEYSGCQFPKSKPKNQLFDNKLRCLYLTSNNLSNSNLLDYLQPFQSLEYLDIAFNNFTHIDGLEMIREKLPQIVQIMYPGNPLNCSWIKSTNFDWRLFTVPKYHRPLFNSSEYSIVNGVYCKD